MTDPAPVPLMVNGFDGSGVSGLPIATRELIARREAALGGAYRLFYDEPVEFVRASGVHLYDPDGVEYLDAYNNVPSVGHSHPRVTEAVSRQLATLNTHTRYLTDGVVGYAERLLATHSIGPAHAMFTCTGSEANDLALRIARTFTGGTGVIVTANAYHGVTAAVAELSPSLGANVPLGAHVRAVPAPAAGVRFRDRGRGRDRGSAAARGAAGGVPGRLDLLVRRGAARPGRWLPRAGGLAGARGGRALHRRRGAVRVRPDRVAPVGVSAARRPGA